MTVRNSTLGGTDWSDGDNLTSADLNDTFDSAIQDSPFYAPVGSVVAWLKSLDGTPSLPQGWVECNGQTINDPASPYNGKTIPNLNGNNYFLKGNSTSGGTGGSVSKTTDTAGGHTHSYNGGGDGNWACDIGGSCKGTNSAGSHSHTIDDAQPPYYEVVWIMRIK